MSGFAKTMTGDRRRWLWPAAGLLLILVLVVLAFAGVTVMPSYLASWLFVLSLPAGALLLATGIETFSDTSEDAVWAEMVLTSLRGLLPLLPVVAIFGLPFLLNSSLTDPHAWPAAGIGRAWFAHVLVDVRMVLFLLLWSGLALLFVTPGRSRRLAGLSFALMLLTGTLAAFDWAMAVEPQLASSSFGLLLLSGQAVSALALAALLAAPERRRVFALPMLVLLCVWAFLHFTQFLVVWSADQPDEALWYLHRLGGLGKAAIVLGALLPLAGLALLPVRRLASLGWPVALVAAMTLLVRLLESFWLITPAFRGAFTLNFADLFSAAGLMVLAAGLWRTGTLPGSGRAHGRT